MIKNYLITAFRNLVRHKIFSAISISGLAIGMACTIFIFLWVRDEFSYDRFHVHSKEIFRLICDSRGTEYAVTFAPLAHTLEREIPEVVMGTKVNVSIYNDLIRYKDNIFKQRGRMVDSNFFLVFSFPFLRGNPEKALDQANSIVITESLAEKLFGEDEPLGQTVSRNGTDYKVTGVLATIPHNSHLQFDYVIPFRDDPTEWSDWSYYTYLRLNTTSTIQQVNEKINEVYFKYRPERRSQTRLFLQPLTKIHLFSDYKFDVSGQGNIFYVRIFSIIAVLIIVIACINYINLSTARATKRAKEIGLRKVVGAGRNQLVKQFLGESLLICVMAGGAAILMVESLMPFSSVLTGKSLALNLTEIPVVLGVSAIILLTSILAGSYPALLFSSFSSVQIMKDRMILKRGALNLRKFLVTAQFVLSIGLIIGTSVIMNQMRFINHTTLGFDKENLIYLPLDGFSGEKTASMKQRLLQDFRLLSASASDNLPVDQVMSGTDGADWEGRLEGQKVHMLINSVDYDFIKTYKMQMKEGRFFSERFSTDERGVVLNESAVDAMGLTNPLGKRFSYFGEKEARIIGVVKDFHYKPLRKKVEPLILRLDTQNFQYLTLRLKPMHSEFPELIRFIKSALAQFHPEYPFEFHFLDATIEQQYAAEQRMSRIFRYFTGIVIVLSCLGLFGLSTFMAEQRIKEIGVRKVLGASEWSIVTMLSRDFLQWVLLGNIIAWPIAYYAMQQWLQGFAYHTDLTVWPFVLAGLLALGIALFTVSWQAVRAAIANPVEALRYE